MRLQGTGTLSKHDISGSTSSFPRMVAEKSRPWTVAGMGSSHSPSSVGMMSGASISSGMRRPLAAGSTEGGMRTRKGTRIDSSHGTCLPRMPWHPIMSPWSEVKQTMVSDARPVSSRHRSSVPMQSSSAAMCA